MRLMVERTGCTSYNNMASNTKTPTRHMMPNISFTATISTCT